MPELNGAFEKYLHGDGPKFVIVGSGIVSEEVFCTALLHGSKDGTGHFGEIGKFGPEMFVLLRLRDEVDIGKGMRHLMQPHITIGRLLRNAFHKIIPGEVDTGLVYVAHKRTGVESIVVVISQDEDIVEIIELEFFQAKGQLYGNGADQDWHFCGFLYLDIPEVFGMLKKPGAEEKFPLLFQSQPVIIGQVTGDNRMVKGFPSNKTLKLVPVIEALNKHRNRAV